MSDVSRVCDCETFCNCGEVYELVNARTLYDAMVEVERAIFAQTLRPRVYFDYEVRHDAMMFEVYDQQKKGQINHHVVAFAAHGVFDDVGAWLGMVKQ